MLASPAFRSRRRPTGPHQRPPRRPAAPRPRPPPLRRRRRAHRRPLPPVARPVGTPPPARLPRGRAPLGRSGARPRPSSPARGFPPRHPRPRQPWTQARPRGAPGRQRPRQLAAPRRRAVRAGGARPRAPLRLNRWPPRPRLVLLRPRHLHRAFVPNLSSAIRCVPAGVEFSALKTLSLCHCTSDLNALLSCFPCLRTLCYDYDSGVSVFGLWRLEQVKLRTIERKLQIDACAEPYVIFHDESDNSTLEIEKHLVAAFSVLELHLTTEGHAFGAFVFLLGMNRIRCATTTTQRLKVILQRSAMKGGCPRPRLCESLNWRSQTVSLPALKEVEINGFEGEGNGTDFLKLTLKCSPMLKRIIVKLSLEASASNDGCAKICSIFKAHSSAECDVYHSSGIIVKLSLEASASNDGCTKICSILKAHSSAECDVYHISGLMHNSRNCWRM